MEGKRLIWFSGRECVHCKRLRPMIEQFQVETGQVITELEVWHNDENARLMRSYEKAISEACGGSLGVPSFYNERTSKAICGNVTKERLGAWAAG